MTDEETQAARRVFAEKIISGEYQSLVIGIVGEGEDSSRIDLFYDGSACTALGLSTVLTNHIRDEMEE